MRDTPKRTLRSRTPSVQPRSTGSRALYSRRGGTNSAIVTGTPATVARSDPGGAAHPVYGETGASAESARGRIRTCREGGWGELQSGRQIGCVNLGKHLAASDRPVVSARRSAVPPLSFVNASLLAFRQRCGRAVNSWRFNQKKSLRLASECGPTVARRRCMTRHRGLAAPSPAKERARGGGR